MKRRSILLDVDGVLADFTSGYVDIINTQCGTRFTAADVNQWDVCGALRLTKADAARAKRAIGAAQGFAANLRHYPGSIAAVVRLAAIADVRIVTSPWNSNPTWTHDREAWLWKWFDIPHAHVHHTSEKWRVWGDVFVDDKLEAVKAWQAKWPAGAGILWRTPHNIGETWDGVTTNNWDEVIAIVEGVP